MIVTFWKGVFVADTLDERGALKKAGFELHEPTICHLKNEPCKACKAGVGRRWWSNRVESAARLSPFCNERALRVMKEHLELLRKSRAVDTEIEIPTPPGLKFRPYQKAGVAYALGRKDTLIGDEPGLGKTMQAIGFMNVTRPKNTIIVCPATLVFNWRNELEKWLVDQDLEIVEIEAKSDQVPSRDKLVVVANYEKLVGDSSFAASIIERTWDVAVFDEAQLLKNPESKRSQACIGQEGIMRRSHRCLFLTGTPIENYPKEIWPIASAISPAKFGDWWAFARRYCGAHQEERANGKKVWVTQGASHLSELQQKLRATCIHGDSVIASADGPITIREIVSRNLRPHVWSRDPMGRLSLQPVIAGRASPHRNVLVEIRHSKGSLVCTPEHRVFTRDGWKRADTCSTNDHLLILQKEERARVEHERLNCDSEVDVLDEVLWKERPENQEGKVQAPTRSQTEISSKRMPGMREQIHRKERAYLQRSPLLHAEMPWKMDLPELLGCAPVGSRSSQTLPNRSREKKTEAGCRTQRKNHEHRGQASDVRGSQKKVGINAFQGEKNKKIASIPKGKPHAETWTGTPLVNERARSDRRIVRGFITTGWTNHLRGPDVRRLKDDNRNRRPGTCPPGEAKERQRKRRSTGEARVLSVEVLAMGRGRAARGGRFEDPLVYDVQVAKNHNFFADGVLVHNCMVRRLKRDVEKELPPKQRQLVVLRDDKIKWSSDIRFRKWQESFDREYDQKLAVLEAAQTEAEFIEAVSALDKITGVPFEEISELRHEIGKAKLPACLRFLDEMRASTDEPLVIFAHHTDVIEELAKHFSNDAVVVQGKTPNKGPNSREQAVRAFQAGEKKIFIGQMKAAGVGLTLTAASTVVFVEEDWVPGTMTQCEDRLCRIGQKKMVHVIHLTLKNTIEVNMMQKVLAKQKVIDAALDRWHELTLKKQA